MKNRNLFLTVCFMAITAISFAQTQKATNLLVGDTSGSVEASAAIEVESTTQGFLPSRMTSNQMYAIASPAEGLLVYCTNCNPIGLYVANNTGGFTSSSVGIASQAGLAAGEVRSTTGVVWQDKNVGATQVATSINDEAARGGLFQWGRAADGHESKTSTTAAGPVAAGSEGSDFITMASQPFDWLSTPDDTRWTAGANTPCDAGYRLPTVAEITAEIADFTTADIQGGYNSPLKLVTTGWRNRTNGTLNEQGIKRTLIWTSEANGVHAWSLDLNTNYARPYAHDRGYGFGVRCVKE